MMSMRVNAGRKEQVSKEGEIVRQWISVVLDNVSNKAFLFKIFFMMALSFVDFLIVFILVLFLLSMLQVHLISFFVIMLVLF